MDALGVPAREVVEVVVHARHDDGDVAGGREVAEHLGRAPVPRRVEEQEAAIRVVELDQLAQARVGVGNARRAQPRDLVLDRLGVGGVAQRDRRAVEVADQLRVLARERLGDGGVEPFEEGGHRGWVGIAGEQALEVGGGAVEGLAVDRGGRRPLALAARDLADHADRLAGDLLCGPGNDERADDDRDQQQHPEVLGGDLSALPSQHLPSVPRGATARQRRRTQIAPGPVTNLPTRARGAQAHRNAGRRHLDEASGR